MAIVGWPGTSLATPKSLYRPGTSSPSTSELKGRASEEVCARQPATKSDHISEKRHHHDFCISLYRPCSWSRGAFNKIRGVWNTFSVVITIDSETKTQPMSPGSSRGVVEPPHNSTERKPKIATFSKNVTTFGQAHTSSLALLFEPGGRR